MKSGLLPTALSTLSTVALVLASSASARTIQASLGQQTFTAVAFVDSARDVDNPPTGDSQGDMIVFTQKLFTDATQEEQIGTDQVYCIRTVPGSARICTGIFYLRGGTITIIGPESVAPHSLAITGGTGSWRGARGEIALVPNGELEDQMTFHVELGSGNLHRDLAEQRR